MVTLVSLDHNGRTKDWRILFDTARQYREGFDIYGAKKIDRHDPRPWGSLWLSLWGMPGSTTRGITSRLLFRSRRSRVMISGI